MGMDKHSRSMIVNMIFSAIFIVAGLYLAQMYLMEFPNPTLHWEGIAPLLFCLVYYLFS
jgi:hypothetical protein